MSNLSSSSITNSSDKNNKQPNNKRASPPPSTDAAAAMASRSPSPPTVNSNNNNNNGSDGGTAPATTGLPPNVQRDVDQVFDLFDTGGHGVLDCAELKAALSVLNLDVTREQEEQLLHVYRQDPSALGLYKEEFAEIVSVLVQSRGADGLRAQLERDFALFDRDGFGSISGRTLQQICREIGETPNPDLDDFLVELIGSSSMSKDEFVNLLCKRGY
eukprot:PhM_4_TR10863/c0_g3_i1/m.70943/K16465/CETN1; centrin-1